ncbi:hypothetical protein QCE63_35330 [Caballeronia sp. LZ065]|uniref:hypothetical protein n=1 Tax=Caballeronia sp. LZ065 TaxID=3038571 RepID=UPI0028647E9F|nr:hypothetical protein [Caballeronia sp. LZ065]MDR5784664.1 hypothetical protein [Caballeronia sp. LZ065]
MADIKGDLHDMVRTAPKRSGKTTVFEEAGGAHLDLLVSLAAQSPGRLPIDQMMRRAPLFVD